MKPAKKPQVPAKSADPELPPLPAVNLDRAELAMPEPPPADPAPVPQQSFTKQGGNVVPLNQSVVAVGSSLFLRRQSINLVAADGPLVFLYLGNQVVTLRYHNQEDAALAADQLIRAME